MHRFTPRTDADSRQPRASQSSVVLFIRTGQQDIPRRVEAGILQHKVNKKQPQDMEAAERTAYRKGIASSKRAILQAVSKFSTTELNWPSEDVIKEAVEDRSDKILDMNHFSYGLPPAEIMQQMGHDRH